MADIDAFEQWINSFPEYINPEDGQMICIKKPDDIIKIHQALENIFGD